MMMPECDHARTREGGDIDYCRWMETARVVEGVRQDQPALSVGVQDLHGLAGGAGGDIAWLDRLAARHVLDGGDESDDAHRQFELRDEIQRRDDGSAAAHVELH